MGHVPPLALEIQRLPFTGGRHGPTIFTLDVRGHTSCVRELAGRNPRLEVETVCLSFPRGPGTGGCLCAACRLKYEEDQGLGCAPAGSAGPGIRGLGSRGLSPGFEF